MRSAVPTAVMPPQTKDGPPLGLDESPEEHRSRYPGVRNVDVGCEHPAEAGGAPLRLVKVRRDAHEQSLAILAAQRDCKDAIGRSADLVEDSTALGNARS